jgi:alpha/beta superfamily hydrolase
MMNSTAGAKRFRFFRVAWKLVLLAACVVLPFGCNADTLVLGTNRQIIDPKTATEKFIRAEGRQIDVWLARSPGAKVCEPKAYVLFFIGKGDRADRWICVVADSWGQLPVEIWGMNYPGSGRTDGPAKIASVSPDALAVYDALRVVAGGRPIFVQGGSFGTTVALSVAARRHVDGVILQNPPPLRELIVGEFSWWNLGLLSHRIAAEVPADLDSLANARQATAPAILLSAGSDHTIPPKYHRMVIDNYAGPKRIIDMPGRGHDDPLSHDAAEKLEEGRQWLWNLATVPKP